MELELLRAWPLITLSNTYYIYVIIYFHTYLSSNFYLLLHRTLCPNFSAMVQNNYPKWCANGSQLNKALWVNFGGRTPGLARRVGTLVNWLETRFLVPIPYLFIKIFSKYMKYLKYSKTVKVNRQLCTLCRNNHRHYEWND